jgi:hypothetical protein
MTSNNDLDLKQLADDWQSSPYDVESAEQIRRYVSQRTGLLWSFAVADFVVGGVALPVLVYLGWVTKSGVERMAMMSLASITLAAVMFGWWNRRGVLRASATTIADYVAISVERLRRMRMALRSGWLLLAAEVTLFSIWIWDRLYSGPPQPTAGAERFAWTWLLMFTLAAIVGLLYFGRWISRDAARFAAVREELDSDYTAQSTSTGDNAPIRWAGVRAIKKPRRPPLT